ncbi:MULTISPECIES: S9 family peptidase [Arenibacter]|uniref:S9 family peptidase n=1 Tax=Arenibacter TaxID=178469 RepID=UPI0004DF3481|nr:MULTISPECIES: S9 family peptidase [Arenibacter]GBF22353.1 prolyl tripeptidyl peptidase precursor [Arenibacter sp. NBRC 103722]
MRKFPVLLIIVLLLCNFSILSAQNKQIAIGEIYDGTFTVESLDKLQSMDNGKQYTILNIDRSLGISTIEKYDYKTQKKLETIVSSSASVPFFSSYEFSEDESKLLLATAIEPIFRRSTLGYFYVYDLKSKKISAVSNLKIQEPSLSPDGSKVAYVYNNNIFVWDIAANYTKQLTLDGVKNKILNGITDWVYEEEFAFVRAFEWNSDGSKLAFIRFDETKVPEFSMDVYGANLYQTQTKFKYPKAGEVNSEVSLHIVDVDTYDITKVDLDDPYYIPRIKWMNDPNFLSVQTLNRHQNKLRLYAVNARNNTVSIILEETDDAYVSVTDDLTFLADDSFIWTSEKDGFKHIYLYNVEGKLMNQVTKGPWEVTKFYGYDQNEDLIYYQSTENGSINRDVYSVRSNGKNKRRLTTKLGQNTADFSADFTYFVNAFSNASTPPEYTLHDALNGKKVKDILNNQGLISKLEDYRINSKEFSTIAINGHELNMWMIKPHDFDPTKKYPLFMTQYSGPGSQKVSNSWMDSNDYWFQMLANEGYIVVCVDGRGTGYKGADFKKVTYKELGKYEVEDQIAAAKKLSELSYIDESRTGIWGWSYGGFMSTNCLLKGNDTFEMAIAVAPVTSWRFYDTIYTERFMRTPHENPSGYDENSPFNYPELLKGKYLLVHGSADDNVHVQNTMRMVEAFVQANKQFDWAIYPDKNHSIFGGNTRLHLYTKMTDFIKENL